jgi:hypothetical protein
MNDKLRILIPIVCYGLAIGVQACATRKALPRGPAPAPHASPVPASEDPERGVDDMSSFEAIRAKSRRESRSPEAVAWERTNAPWMGPQLMPVMNSCRTTAPEGQDASFTLLVRLGNDGRVRNSLVSPSTPFTLCVRSGLAQVTFPEAPWDGYWLEIEMRQ